jgi:hypothetical protein
VARIDNEISPRGEDKDPEFQRNARRQMGTTAHETDDDEGALEDLLGGRLDGD